VREVGSRFKLRTYWGPLASAEAPRWIANAAATLLGVNSALLPSNLWTLAMPVLAAVLAGFRGVALVKIAVQLSIVGAAIFLATNPYYVLSFETMRTEVAHNSAMYGFSPGVGAFLGVCRNQLVNVVPLPLAALALAGLFSRRLSRVDLALLLIVPVVNLFLVSAAINGREDPALVRFALPTLPVICLFAGLGYDRVRERLPATGAALLIVGVGANLVPTAYCVADRIAASHGSAPEIEAARWIERSVPPGARIGLRWLPNPRTCPPFPLDRFCLRVIPGPLESDPDLPRFFVQPNPVPPTPRYERVASFVPWTGWTRLVPSGRVAREAERDLLEHSITLGGFRFGHPLQLHQVPFYVFQRRQE
ncbi:MAG: hypothetical protein HY815_33385, partial [Candidatus Riflebacteria bacterium]|nr:hypothetical protein [Candidatus Riflebacteria bacterium]